MTPYGTVTTEASAPPWSAENGSETFDPPSSVAMADP